MPSNLILTAGVLFATFVGAIAYFGLLLLIERAWNSLARRWRR